MVGQGSHTETIREPRQWNYSFGSLIGCPILTLVGLQGRMGWETYRRSSFIVSWQTQLCGFSQCPYPSFRCGCLTAHLPNGHASLNWAGPIPDAAGSSPDTQLLFLPN